MDWAQVVWSNQELFGRFYSKEERIRTETAVFLLGHSQSLGWEGGRGGEERKVGKRGGGGVG